MRKRLSVVAVVVLSVMVAVPLWGAQFRRKTISDQHFIDMCKEGDTQGVIEAIKAGANVNAKDQGGWTALMWAADNGYTEIVNALIEAGADDLTDNEGRTALIRAAASWSGNAQTVNALIDAGSNVKQKDNNGITALDYARTNRRLKDSSALERLEELSR